MFKCTKLVFLKLGYAKGCRRFWETKKDNCGRVLLVVLNFCVWIKIHVMTFDANHSVTDSTQTIITFSIQKLPDSVVKSVSAVRHTKSMCRVKQSGYWLVRGWPFIFYIMCIKDKQMLVLNFVFDLLWTNGDSLVSSVAFLGFHVG
jgi:hypothetical protein